MYFLISAFVPHYINVYQETKLLSAVCLVSVGLEQEINLDNLAAKVGEYDASISTTGR